MMRDEIYLWGPCAFDVEAAKALVPTATVVTIKPRALMRGMPVQVRDKVDLESPVIFATFLRDIKDGGLSREQPIGAVLIDGRHRLEHAIKRRLKLKAAVLSPAQTVNLSSGFSQLTGEHWRKLYSVGRSLGLVWMPRR